MANTRHDIPAGWSWRDGKPYWIPSKVLRDAGWRRHRLADHRGVFLSRGASIDAAAAIVAAVAAWRAGQLVPDTFREIAPDGACDAPRATDQADPLSIGVLIDAYLDSNEIKTRKNGKPRPLSTQRDYRGKLKRMVDVLAGYAKPLGQNAKADPAQLKTYQARVATVRAMSVFVLEPVEGPKGMVDRLYDVYWALHAQGSKHQAYGVLACASAWLAWCHKRRSRTIHNWAEDVERETPPGRIRVWTWPEIAAVVQAADKLGRPEVGDAVILAIDLNWSQIDVLNLTWPQLVAEGDDAIRVMTGEAGRQKTGRVGGVPLTGMGRRRVAAIRERQAEMDAKPLKVVHLVRERQRQKKAGADSDYLRDLFADIRAEAAKTLPSCATLTFADTRDTGVSLGRQAGFTDDQTASRSLHSRKTVRDNLDRSYGEIGPEIADSAHALLDRHIEAMLAQHKVKL